MYEKQWGKLLTWNTKEIVPIFKVSTQPKSEWVDKQPTKYWYELRFTNKMVIAGELNVSPFVAFNQHGSIQP